MIAKNLRFSATQVILQHYQIMPMKKLKKDRLNDPLVSLGGLEPPTHSLEGCCSILLSYRPKITLAASRPPKSGAGDGNRTHVISLEGWSSTIELHPQNIYRSQIQQTCLDIIQQHFRLVYTKRKAVLKENEGQSITMA